MCMALNTNPKVLLNEHVGYLLVRIINCSAAVCGELFQYLSGCAEDLTEPQLRRDDSVKRPAVGSTGIFGLLQNGAP
jgi:hypothetical protein